MKTIFLFLICLNVMQLSAQQVETFIDDANREFESIYWGINGNIYSADYNNGRIYQIFPDGTVTTIVSGFSNLAGGGFDNNEDFYFSGIANGTLLKLNDDGTYTQIADGLNQPVGVLPSDNPDILYVVEYGDNSISKVTINSGAVETWVSNNGIDGPDGIIYHPSGDILVANFNNNKIHRVDSNGNISLFATLPSAGFMGYITRAGDYFYVPSFNGRKIYKIDLEGNIELFAGTGIAGSQDGPLESATFNNPNGIVSNLTGDTLLITDNNKVRMITGFAPVINSLSELQLNQSIIKPNPVEETLNLSFQLDNRQELEWQIYNSTGVLILEAPFTEYYMGENQINIHLEIKSPGVYILKLNNKKGDRKHFQFIKN